MKKTTKQLLIGSAFLCLWVGLASRGEPQQSHAHMMQITPTPTVEQAQNSFTLPTLVPPDVLDPFPTPEGEANLLILALVVSDTLTLDPENSLVTRGYGSNALNPQAGAWTVNLLTADGNTIDLSIADPNAVYVYDTDGNGQTHRLVPDAPPIYLDGAPYTWNLALPVDGELLVREINKIELLDEKRQIRFSAELDLERERIVPLDIGKIDPLGEITQPEELSLVEDRLSVRVDALPTYDEIDVAVGAGGQAEITVESGQLTFIPQERLTWLGFQLENTPAWQEANPNIKIFIAGRPYTYSMFDLELRNGHILQLGDSQVQITVTESEQGRTLDISSVSGAPIDKLTIGGEEFQLSNITVNTEE